MSVTTPVTVLSVEGYESEARKAKRNGSDANNEGQSLIDQWVITLEMPQERTTVELINLKLVCRQRTHQLQIEFS